MPQTCKSACPKLSLVSTSVSSVYWPLLQNRMDMHKLGMKKDALCFSAQFVLRKQPSLHSLEKVAVQFCFDCCSGKGSEKIRIVVPILPSRLPPTQLVICNFSTGRGGLLPRFSLVQFPCRRVNKNWSTRMEYLGGWWTVEGLVQDAYSLFLACLLRVIQ